MTEPGWALAAWVIGAFLIGSINPASLIAAARGVNIASAGSGNPGATNMGRVLGKRWGVLVGVLDILKGLLPTLAAVHWAGLPTGYAVGWAAVAGHIFSPFLRGRGGKGVATTMGAILGVHWWVGLIMLAVFVVTVRAWRWVAGASVTSAAALMLLGLASFTGRVFDLDWQFGIFALALGLLVVYRHLGQLVGCRADRR